MKCFTRIFIGCCIWFIGMMAGVQFERGNIGLGILDLLLAVPSLINLAIDFDY